MVFYTQSTMRGHGVHSVHSMHPSTGQMLRIIKARNFVEEWDYSGPIAVPVPVDYDEVENPSPRQLWIPNSYPLWPGSVASDGKPYGFNRAAFGLQYPDPSDLSEPGMNTCNWGMFRAPVDTDAQANIGEPHQTPIGIDGLKLGDYIIINVGFSSETAAFPTYYFLMDDWDQTKTMHVWKSDDDGFTWTPLLVWPESSGWLAPYEEGQPDGGWQWGTEIDPLENGRTAVPFWNRPFVYAGKGKIILPNSWVPPVYKYPAGSAGTEPERKPPSDSPIKLSSFNGNVFVVQDGRVFGKKDFYVWQTRETCNPTWDEGSTIGPVSFRKEGTWRPYNMYTRSFKDPCCEVSFPAERNTSRIRDYFYIGAPLQTRMYKLGLWSSTNYLYFGYNWEASEVQPYISSSEDPGGDGDGYGGPMDDRLHGLLGYQDVKSSTEWGVQTIGGKTAPFSADGTGYKQEGYCEVLCHRGPENIMSRETWGPPPGTYLFNAWYFDMYWSGPHPLGGPYHWNGSAYGDFTSWRPWRTYVYTLVNWYDMPIPITVNNQIIWNSPDLSDEMKDFLLNHDLYSIYDGTFGAYYHQLTFGAHGPPEGHVHWDWVGSQNSSFDMFEPSLSGSVPARNGYEYPVFVERVGKALSEDQFIQSLGDNIIVTAKSAFVNGWGGTDKTRTYKRTSEGDLAPLTTYNAPGWAEFYSGVATYMPGTCGVQIITHGVGNVDNSVVTADIEATHDSAGPAKNPPPLVYLSGSPRTRGPFHMPNCDYTKFDDYRPAVVTGRNTTFGVRKYIDPIDGVLYYTWCYTLDNALNLINVNIDNPDFKPTETEYDAVAGVVDASRSLFHYLGQDRSDRPVILWAKGGIADWAVTIDYGARWFRAIPEYCGDRINGRVPIASMSGLSNPSIYVLGPGQFLIVASVGASTTQTGTFQNLGTSMRLQEAETLPAPGGISALHYVKGNIPDPEGGPDIQKDYDTDRFAYDYDKVVWKGSDIASEAPTLEISYDNTSGRYIVLHLWEYGLLGSIVGWYNQEPKVDVATGKVDTAKIEHFLVPSRMPQGVPTSVFPAEINGPFETTPDAPDIPYTWEQIS